MFLLFFCVSAGGAILFFCVQVYTAIFLKTIVKLPSELVDRLSIFATLVLLPLTIFAGWLSDKVGRKPVVVCGLALGALLIMPAYQLLRALGSAGMDLNQNSPQILLIAAILFGLSTILAMVVGPQTALLAELFPSKTRNSAATLPHNLAAGWVGGLLPLIVTWINQYWVSELAGLWYPTLFLAAGAIVAWKYLPETYRNKLRD